jgi:hypothetical protein
MLNTQRHDRQAALLLESLDDRLLLSGGAAGATAAAAVHYHPASDMHRDHRSRPREVLRGELRAALSSNFAPALRLLYREFEGPGGHSRVLTSPPVDRLLISGTRVAVAIKVAFPPALGGFFIRDLRVDGLRVLRTVPAHGVAEGMLPIAKLPAVAPIAAQVELAPLSIMKQLHRDTHR